MLQLFGVDGDSLGACIGNRKLAGGCSNRDRLVHFADRQFDVDGSGV